MVEEPTYTEKSARPIFLGTLFKEKNGLDEKFQKVYDSLVKADIENIKLDRALETLKSNPDLKQIENQRIREILYERIVTSVTDFEKKNKIINKILENPTIYSAGVIDTANIVTEGKITPKIIADFFKCSEEDVINSSENYRMRNPEIFFIVMDEFMKS